MQGTPPSDVQGSGNFIMRNTGNSRHISKTENLFFYISIFCFDIKLNSQFYMIHDKYFMPKNIISEKSKTFQ